MAGNFPPLQSCLFYSQSPVKSIRIEKEKIFILIFCRRLNIYSFSKKELVLFTRILKHQLGKVLQLDVQDIIRIQYQQDWKLLLPILQQGH